MTSAPAAPARTGALPVTTADAVSPRRWWVLGATSISVLLAALNTSTLVIALPHLIRDLHTGVLQATWVLLAYILAQAAVVLSVGRLGDLWGRRPLFLAGTAAFTACSLLSGFAPSVGVLIGLRVLAGFSAALVVASSSAIVTDASRSASSALRSASTA